MSTDMRFTSWPVDDCDVVVEVFDVFDVLDVLDVLDIFDVVVVDDVDVHPKEEHVVKVASQQQGLKAGGNLEMC